MRLASSFLGLALILGPPLLADGEEPLSNWPSPPYWSPQAVKAERSALVAPNPLPFIALQPCRIVDTRGNAPLTGGFLPAATVRSYTVTNVCGIPPGAQALSLNATVVHPTGPGFLTLYPEGGSFPPVSTLNYLGNDVIVNAAVVPLSGAGGISMALGVSGGDVILDTNGYYAPQTVVTTLNGASGAVTLAAGSNVTLTPSGSTLTIASTAAGGSPSGPAGGGLSGSYPNPTVVSTPLESANTIVSRDASGSFEAGHLAVGGKLKFRRQCSSETLMTLDDEPLAYAGCLRNTFFGRLAGEVLAFGGYNAAFGDSALSALGYAEFNSAFGSNALLNNTTGSYNTAVGQGSLATQSYAGPGYTWGSFNTAVGAGSLYQNQPTSTSNGTENTAVGTFSLEANTTGFQNTAVGVHAGNRTGAATGYVGSITYVANTTGAYNTFVGRGTGTTSSNLFNCTAVGIDAYCDGDNQVRLGNTWVGSIGGKVGWSALSDARAKTDIRDLDLGLDFVLGLHPVQYRMRLGNGRVDMGFLAQDVERLLGGDYNVVTVGGDPARTLSLRYTDLIAPLVKAVQEQQTLNQAQQAMHREQLEARDARIAQLERRLAVLEERATAAGSRR